MRYNCLPFIDSASILFRFYSVLMKVIVKFCLLLSIFLVGSGLAAAQQPQAKSQEVSEEDGLPVLLRHLPDYERVKDAAVFTTDKAGLKSAVGNEAVLDLLDFDAGTEAVTAAYPQGRLVIVEFTNPQASTETDTRIQQFLATNSQPATAYRRIGNYNVFVFGGGDPAAANALLDEVKYEKSIQWLGEDPFLIRKLERYMVMTSKDIMISTILVIVFGLGGSIVAGIAAGFIFFRIRDQKRASRRAFSDAGGLTRLNLDGLSE